MITTQIGVSLTAYASVSAYAATANAETGSNGSEDNGSGNGGNDSSNPVEKADKPNDPTTVYDLVTLVIDTELDQDNNNYLGLRDDGYADKLSDTKIGHRILRYAEDLKKNNNLTDVKILFFDKEKDSVETLSEALENVYLNGDGTRNNRLAGVVLIGNIPLPAVNKNGNRYVSMFPYTDFSEKAYIYNKKSKSFERNDLVSFPRPEIWHGVIKPPSNNSAGREKLAEFFDKNHLYYEGEPAFAKFDRKMFFGDLVNEEEQINDEMYKRYMDYLDAMENLAYMRYNKFWAAKLVSKISADLPINPDHPANKSQNGNPGFGDSIKSSDPIGALPDIHTASIINNVLRPYSGLLTKYLSKTNDFAYFTGRYNPRKTPSGINTVPSLISIKDETVKRYLKSVNAALEEKINTIAKKIEEPLPIIETSMLSGEFGTHLPNGGSLGNEAFDVPVIDTATGVAKAYLEELPFRFNYYREASSNLFINGINADKIESAKQCSVFLGSTKTEDYNWDTLQYAPKDGQYSLLTRAMR
ncbi:MAG: hypothetical protein AAB540_01435, partial [Patescibacteria group bacterium]